MKTKRYPTEKDKYQIKNHKGTIIYNVINVDKGLTKTRTRTNKQNHRYPEGKHQNMNQQYQQAMQYLPSYATYGMNRFSDGNGQVQDNFLKYYLLSQQQNQNQNPMIEDLTNRLNDFQQNSNQNFLVAGNLLTNLSNRFDRYESQPYQLTDSAGIGTPTLNDDEFIPQTTNDRNIEPIDEPQLLTTTREVSPRIQSIIERFNTNKNPLLRKRTEDRKELQEEDEPINPNDQSYNLGHVYTSDSKAEDESQVFDEFNTFHENTEELKEELPPQDKKQKGRPSKAITEEKYTRLMDEYLSLGGSEETEGWKIKDFQNAIRELQQENEKHQLSQQYKKLFGIDPKPEWTNRQIKFRIDQSSTEIERLNQQQRLEGQRLNIELQKIIKKQKAKKNRSNEI